MIISTVKVCALCGLALGFGSPQLPAQQKLKVKSVTFHGNQTFKNDDLYQAMITRPSGFLAPSYYDQNQLQDDLRSLEIFYHRQGFLQAKTRDYHVAVDTTQHHVQIWITITEGERTLVDTLRISGNQAFATGVLLERTKIRKGEPLSYVELDRTLDAILERYLEQGYWEAQINSHIEVDSLANLASVDLVLEENSRFKIDRIVLNGLRRTTEEVVRRELQFHPGDLVNSTQILNSQRRLYGTGLFRSVFMRTQPSASGDSAKKDITIELREDKAGEFHVASGYGTVEKLRASVELFHGNSFGKALKSGIEGQYSTLQKSLEAFVTEPWLLGIPWSANVSAGIGVLAEPGYGLEAIGGEMSLGHEFFRRSTLKFAFETGVGRLKDLSREIFAGTPVDTFSTEIQNLILANLHINLNFQSFTSTLAFDTRNNLFDTSAGSYFEFNNTLYRSYSEAGLFDNVIKQSNRSIGFEALGKAFYAPSPAMTFASAVDLGVIYGLSGSTGEIPASELFYTGVPTHCGDLNIKRWDLWMLTANLWVAV